MHIRISLILAAATLCSTAYAGELVNDKAITIQSVANVEKTRKKLISYLWGDEGLPLNRFPDRMVTNVTSPVQHLEHLRRVDELRMDLAPGLEGLAYHFIPEQPNGALVILHHGHACTMDDDPSPQEIGHGMQRTIQALLAAGYGVAGVFMPHMRPGDCTGKHEAMFDIKTTGSPIKFFLEPTAITLNYLGDRKKADANQFQHYKRFHMIGLSGGGWTTTVYAALDPRIQCSFSIAGTMPLYLRSGGSIGDREQFEPAFYQLAGYPDLYILGAHGANRAQIQVVIRKDDCCFGERQHDAKATAMDYATAVHSYGDRVQSAMKQLGKGTFRLEIDEVAPSHMISHHVLATIILPELKKSDH